MEIKELYKEMTEKINQIISENNVDVFNFFMSSSPENQKTHELILNVLKDYLSDIVDTQELVMLNRNEMLKIYERFKTEKMSLSVSEEYQKYLIIKKYIFDFNYSFFKIKNGEINKTKFADKFILPSICDKPDYDANAKFLKNNFTKTHDNKYDQLCLIILPDGTCYQTPDDHETLAYWLNVNGVNLKNAIRFEATQSLYDFSFTSLHNYKFSNNSDDDELIEMTHEQAEIIGTLYGSLLQCWKYMKPLSGEIKNSSGFGFGKTEKFEEGGISSKNLNRLALYTKDFFDKGEYIRELKLKNNTHNPLK